MTIELLRSVEKAIGVNRLGLGARPGEVPMVDPVQWLDSQLDRYDPKPIAVSSGLVSKISIAAHREQVRAWRELPDEEEREKVKAFRVESQNVYRQEVEMRVQAALDTPTPFPERLVHFWSNHFAVSTIGPTLTWLAGSYEREAIRPYVLGRFEDMLLAVETHPAMLIYLDQARSIGPNSLQAARINKRYAGKAGLNENLAREILELHTLGAKTPYTQKDVTEFARALTGWGRRALTDGPTEKTDDPYFATNTHEPGTRVVLGKNYVNSGMEQGKDMLRDLARHPATASNIAVKLARHFISDDPPAPVVAALRDAFLKSDGDLPTVYRTLVQRPEAWDSRPAKFKSPWEWAVSALRALDKRNTEGINMVTLLRQLGQPVWHPGSPAGYDDTTSAWAAPDALMKRVEAARLLTAGERDLDAREIGRALLPGLGKTTEREIRLASSAQAGLILLLVSPEFLRR